MEDGHNSLQQHRHKGKHFLTGGCASICLIACIPGEGREGKGTDEETQIKADIDTKEAISLGRKCAGLWKINTKKKEKNQIIFV